MTKKETKGRSVVSSIIVLMLCFAMLLGTTYAWFTDSKSTAINQVKSGTLKVDIVDKEGTSLVGQTLKFIKAAGHENEEVLWEPGCTYKVQEFYIKNTGKLALKYKVYVNGIDGDAKLLEVIDWTNTHGKKSLAEFEGYLLPGETDKKAIVIEGHMQETAGNEYQDLTADGIGVTVVATQYTVEHDSYNNQYDKNAEYPVTDIDDFKEAVSNMKAGETTVVNLTQDLDFTKLPETPSGTLYTGSGIEVPEGATLVVNGAADKSGAPTVIKVAHTAFNNGVGNEGLLGNTNVQFNNVKFVAETPGSGYAVCTGFDFKGTVEFNNCVFDGLYTAVYMNQNASGTPSTLIIKDCTYTNTNWGYGVDTYTSKQAGSMITYDKQVTVTFEGNTGIADSNIRENTWE